MAEPNEVIGGGMAGCGCLGLAVFFFVALFSVGFGGAVLLTIIGVVMLAYVVSLVS